MESGIQSTFIPHDTAMMGTGGRISYERGGLSDLILLSSIVLFLASAALGGGVFLYQGLLTASVEEKKGELKRVHDQFDMPLIHEMSRMEARMKSAEKIVHGHIAPSAFFKALNIATLSTISFKSLDFSATDAQHINIKMTGVAQSVNSIALQAEVFSNNGVITSPIFSSIDRQQDGVHFNLTALINPQSLLYSSPAQAGADSGSSSFSPTPSDFHGPSVSNQPSNQPVTVPPSGNDVPAPVPPTGQQ